MTLVDRGVARCERCGGTGDRADPLHDVQEVTGRDKRTRRLILHAGCLADQRRDP